MEKRTKIILGVIGAGLGVYVIYKIMKRPTEDNTINEQESNSNTNKPKPPKKTTGPTNADVLFPKKENFSWSDYFFGIKPIWSRL